jgi:hypothetical protein
MPPKRPSRAKASAELLPALPPSPPPPAPIALPRPEGAWRVLALLASFFQPVAGLVLALLYWRGVDTPVRRFSRWCLALAILGWLFAGGTDAVQSGLHHGDWYIQPY